MKMTKLALVALIAGSGLSAGAMAATADGTLGATSTGTVDVTLTVPKLIRITGLATIALGSYSGDGSDMTGTSPGCVRQNGTTATYGILVTSANGAFDLDAGAGTLPYSVSWGGSAVTYNTNLASQAPDSTTLGACTSVADKLSVTVLGTDLDAAPGGSYSDTLTLVVEPE